MEGPPPAGLSFVHHGAAAEAAKQAPGCEPNGAPAGTCAYDPLVAGVTSAIYLGG